MNCRRENSERLDHVHHRGNKLLLKVLQKTLRKVERTRRGPFTVISHNDNGTVTIQKGPCFTDSVNIRRVDPFFEQ